MVNQFPYTGGSIWVLHISLVYFTYDPPNWLNNYSFKIKYWSVGQILHYFFLRNILCNLALCSFTWILESACQVLWEEKSYWDSDWNCTKCVDQVERIDSFMILNLSIQEHGLSLYLRWIFKQLLIKFYSSIYKNSAHLLLDLFLAIFYFCCYNKWLYF